MRSTLPSSPERHTVTGELSVTAFAAVSVEEGVERPLGQLASAADIPPAVRRRMRGLPLLALRCGLGALKAESRPVEVVFSCRHGDLRRTRRLLSGLAEDRMPSPLEFSLSVHNALAGMLDLTRQERTGHTSIAAGADSFAMGLLEASARLALSEHHAVLLLYVEEPIPQELHGQTDPDQGGTIVAMLLEGHDAANRLAVMRPSLPSTTEPRESEAEARSVLAAIEGANTGRLASRAGFDWIVESAS
ncbi:MAG: beta-ketoacyl synthase chain length factor [Pseudomonadota bacterium]